MSGSPLPDSIRADIAACRRRAATDVTLVPDPSRKLDEERKYPYGVIRPASVQSLSPEGPGPRCENRQFDVVGSTPVQQLHSRHFISAFLECSSIPNINTAANDIFSPTTVHPVSSFSVADFIAPLSFNQPRTDKSTPPE